MPLSVQSGVGYKRIVDPCGTPEVSIVTPVHNGRAFIERAMRSVREQTCVDWEHLIVDDGSQDGSFEACLALAGDDPRFRVLRLPQNRGSSAARNVALAHARAPTIGYLDADDEYYPDFVARVVELRGRADVLVFRYDITCQLPGPRFGQTWTHDPAQAIGRMPQVNPFTPLAVAHTRELLARVGGFDESIWFEVDWDLWKRFARADATFHCVEHRSGLYHARPDSQARTKRPPDARD